MSTPSPILILVGSDSFLIQRELERIKKQTLPVGLEDFNFNRFSLEEIPTAQVIDACQMLPMMADKRLVIATHAEEMKKDSFEMWLAYFENPSPTTQLVLVAEKIDKRLKLWQRADKSGWMQELKPPYPNQLPAWLQKEASFKGLALSPDAALALAESIGVNLMALELALEKLELYTTPRKKIELADVEALSGSFLSKTVFDLADNVGKRKFSEASRLFEQLLENGEPPVRLLFMMARHFRILLIAQEGMKNRLPERELAGKMGVSPFFVKSYLDQARELPATTLIRIYRDLLATDRALKSSPLNSKHVLTSFLMRACLENCPPL